MREIWRGWSWEKGWSLGDLTNLHFLRWAWLLAVEVWWDRGTGVDREGTPHTRHSPMKRRHRYTARWPVQGARTDKDHFTLYVWCSTLRTTHVKYYNNNNCNFFLVLTANIVNLTILAVRTRKMCNYYNYFSQEWLNYYNNINNNNNNNSNHTHSTTSIPLTHGIVDGMDSDIHESVRGTGGYPMQSHILMGCTIYSMSGQALPHTINLKITNNNNIFKIV